MDSVAKNCRERLFGSSRSSVTNYYISCSGGGFLLQSSFASGFESLGESGKAGRALLTVLLLMYLFRAGSDAGLRAIPIDGYRTSVNV